MKKYKMSKKTVIIFVIVLLLIAWAVRDMMINMESPKEPFIPSGTYSVEYIDVGQADCIYITNQEETMLIDAGNNEDGELVCDYLENKGVKTIDYLIGTHPHEDHIGGLDNVIDTFEIENIYMPDVSADTKTYDDVLDSAKSKNMDIESPKVGDKWELGNAKCEVLSSSTAEDKSNLNEWSIVIYMQIGEVTFMFTGDCESGTEKNILDLHKDIDTTYYKVAHHGSSTSNTKEFLKEVNPQTSIISSGKDNSYGHPHKEVLKELEKYGDVYRTDKDGTVIVTTNGESSEISTVKTNTNG